VVGVDAAYEMAKPYLRRRRQRPNLDPLGTVYAHRSPKAHRTLEKTTDGVVLGPVTVANGLVFASTTRDCWLLMPRPRLGVERFPGQSTSHPA